MDYMQYVIYVPPRGHIVGPFPNRERAEAYANNTLGTVAWEVRDLWHPDVGPPIRPQGEPG